MQTSCPLVKNILLLDSEGHRVAVKYYGQDAPTTAQQQAFEKSIFTKTQRTNARGEPEIILFDNTICVYKVIADLHFFVTGSADDNELILVSVLNAFVEAVVMLLRNNVEKKTVLENLDLVLLTVDELCDGGIIMETEPATIAGRVSMRGADQDVPITEQTFSQALASAKEQLARSLLK
mmetsp:Transcript_8127/g.28567  ORF Transcript_8127/g.28567 Transcript_8127/m.28567 type:complete len:179 (-) Transcript_8127:933-1469(-)